MTFVMYNLIPCFLYQENLRPVLLLNTDNEKYSNKEIGLPQTNVDIQSRVS